MPKKGENEFDYNDLLADLAKDDFWRENEITKSNNFVNVNEEDMFKSFDTEFGPELAKMLDELTETELDDLINHKKRGAEEVSHSNSQEGSAVKRLKEEREKHGQSSNKAGFIR